MSGANPYDALLFAPELNTAQVDGVERILSEAKYDISEVRLSEGVGRMTLRGGAFEGAGATAGLDAAEALGVDLFVLPARRPAPRLFVFDMDSTLIQAEIIDELAGLARVKPHVAAITERAMRGEIDFRAALAERLALLKGVEESRLVELTERVLLSEGLETLIRGLKAAHVKTAILSGGFGFFARHLQRKLGFDHIVCNELEIVDGKLTGRVAAEIVDASRKAAAFRDIAEREGVEMAECVAVGDGANDLPMITMAGIGVAYRAKPKVRAAARYRLNFANLDALLNLL